MRRGLSTVKPAVVATAGQCATARSSGALLVRQDGSIGIVATAFRQRVGRIDTQLSGAERLIAIWRRTPLPCLAISASTPARV